MLTIPDYIQYGYNQILTATVADAVVFNSQFNKISFLDNINSFFNKQPNCKPGLLTNAIYPYKKLIHSVCNSNASIRAGHYNRAEKLQFLRVRIHL